MSRKTKAVLTLAMLALPGSTLAGCHSAFVQATVVNRTGGAVHLLEVDYPSASFGVEELAAGATFKYRFKILGSGTAKASWTDAGHHEYTGDGSPLHEGQEGSLQITLVSGGKARWDSHLTP